MSVPGVLAAIARADKLPLEDRLWAVAQVRELAAERRKQQTLILVSPEASPEDKMMAKRRQDIIDAAMAIIDAIDLSK